MRLHMDLNNSPLHLQPAGLPCRFWACICAISWASSLKSFSVFLCLSLTVCLSHFLSLSLSLSNTHTHTHTHTHTPLICYVLSFFLFCHVSIASPIINTPHRSGAFVKIDEPTLTHCNHPKFIIYIVVHSWCCTFSELGQMCNDMYPSLWSHMKCFHGPKDSAYTFSPLSLETLIFLVNVIYLKLHSMWSFNLASFI